MDICKPAKVKVLGIRQRSEKRASQEKEYAAGRIKFLAENKWCVVFPTLRATQVHHGSGRIEKLLTDFSRCFPVSAKGHLWIHNNVDESRVKGWITDRYQANKEVNKNN